MHRHRVLVQTLEIGLITQRRKVFAPGTCQGRLQQAGVGPARLRALMARLLDDLARPAPAPASSGWYLRLAVGPEAQREGAEHLAASARAAQLPARVVSAGSGRIQVLVGPLTTRDAAFLERVRFRFPHLKPVWQEGL